MIQHSFQLAMKVQGGSCIQHWCVLGIISAPKYDCSLYCSKEARCTAPSRGIHHSQSSVLGSTWLPVTPADSTVMVAPAAQHHLSKANTAVSMRCMQSLSRLHVSCWWLPSKHSVLSRLGLAVSVLCSQSHRFKQHWMHLSLVHRPQAAACRSCRRHVQKCCQQRGSYSSLLPYIQFP